MEAKFFFPFVFVLSICLYNCRGTATGTKINNPPSIPSNPVPSNAAIETSISPTLEWSCTDIDGDSLTYDVFCGTTNPPTTQITAGQRATSISLSGLLKSMTYYWKVIAQDSKGVITNGNVWSFTTIFMETVAGGIYRAGSTSVTISNFKMDRHEVTYELWTKVRAWGFSHGYTDLPIGGNGCNPIGVNNPVTQVSWYDVVKWCNARSEMNGLEPVYYTNSSQTMLYRTDQLDINADAVKWSANGYRLPTEAEWEFAARGGNLTHGYSYSGSNSIDSVGWCQNNTNRSSGTYRVGAKRPNELGLYDMSGNVWEWCWDWYGSAYPSGGTIDPKGPSTTQIFRFCRGGCFGCYDDYCTVYFRCGNSMLACSGMGTPDMRYNSYGFRCVKN